MEPAQRICLRLVCLALGLEALLPLWPPTELPGQLIVQSRHGVLRTHKKGRTPGFLELLDVREPGRGRELKH